MADRRRAGILGGLYALAGTLCVVELGTALPSAGGWYVYARRAFGDAAGFSVGACDWLAQSAALAYLGVSVGDFMAALWPALAPAAKAAGIVTLVLFAGIQWLGLRSSSWTQQATSLIKGLALLAFVAVCFLHAPTPAALGDAAVARPGLTLVALMFALQSVVVTYDGWYTAIYFTEEDPDPGRNLPRSALGGVLCTVVLYLLVNLGLVHVLSVKGLAATSLPAAAVAQILFGGAGGAIVTALCLVSLLSVVNAVLLLATRILFAVARDGFLTERATAVNAAGTPVPAMLMTTGSASLMVLSGTFEQLVGMASVLNGVSMPRVSWLSSCCGGASPTGRAPSGCPATPGRRSWPSRPRWCSSRATSGATRAAARSRPGSSPRATRPIACWPGRGERGQSQEYDRA